MADKSFRVVSLKGKATIHAIFTRPDLNVEARQEGLLERDHAISTKWYVINQELVAKVAEVGLPATLDDWNKLLDGWVTGNDRVNVELATVAALVEECPEAQWVNPRYTEVRWDRKALELEEAKQTVLTEVLNARRATFPKSC